MFDKEDLILLVSVFIIPPCALAFIIGAITHTL